MGNRGLLNGSVCLAALLSMLNPVHAPAATSVSIEGRVLESFDQDHALVQAANQIFRIRLVNLGPSDRASLSKVLGEVHIKIPESAIDLAWKLNSSNLDVPEAEFERAPKFTHSMKSAGGLVEINGRRLPSIPSETAFLQVGQQIYVVNKAGLSSDVKAQLERGDPAVTLPQASVLFSWRISSSAPRAGGRTIEKIERVGDKLKITGKALYSFDEPYSLVQSGNRILQLKKRYLSEQQKASLDRIGTTVRLDVPEEAASFIWQIKDDEQPKLRLPASQ